MQPAESRQLNDSFEADFRTSGLDTQPDFDVATNEPEPITMSQNSFNQVKPLRRSDCSTNPPVQTAPLIHQTASNPLTTSSTSEGVNVVKLGLEL